MEKCPSGQLDAVVGITRYLKSQCKKDRQQRDVFFTYNLMHKLCTHHIDKNTGVIRTWPQKQDRLADFFFNKDFASHILSFFRMKWGKKDLRNANKQRLLDLGLQKKVLREEMNGNDSLDSERFWGVQVHSNSDIIAEQ